MVGGPQLSHQQALEESPAMAVPSPEAYKLGFVGAGNMAESISRGVVKSGVVPPSRISTAHRRTNRKLAFESLGIKVFETNAQVTVGANVQVESED